MKTALLTALMTTSFLLAGCNSTDLTKSAINQLSKANGLQVAYDPNSSFGRGLPTQREFNDRYGRDNCALATYMEMRGKYISVKDILVGMAKNEGLDQPGTTARLMRVNIGSSNISFSDFKIGEKRIILLLLLKNSLEIDLKPTWLNLRVTFTSTGIRIS